jgi:hypothetical protein
VPTIETPSPHPSLKGGESKRPDHGGKGEGRNPFWITKGSHISVNSWIICWKNRYFDQIKPERHHSGIL